MTANKAEIEWVWVDLDDTLWDFTTNSRNALGQLYHAENLARFFPSIDDWIRKYLECNHSLWTLYNAGEITKEHLQTERFRQVLANAGHSNEGLTDLCHHLDKEYLGRLGQLSLLVPGAREMLIYLRSKGYKIGIISNGFYEVQYNKLRSSDIEHLIDVVVLSDDIGINKPDRRIFDHALLKASTTAKRCVIIGDNPETDIAGGIAAGWHAIYFNRDNTNTLPTPEGATLITNLNEISRIL